MVGLGRMGGNMAQRLLRGGHTVVAFDQSAAALAANVSEGAAGADSVADLVGRLAPPRAVWLMLPAGEVTEASMEELGGLLAPDDAIIDGGNANYKETLRRGKTLAERGIHLLDAGTSGGIWGLTEGYSLMVGGDPDVFRRLEPIFQALAPGPDRGYCRVGPTGAGHFTKMVHNGVEYGLMQAYAEGFELLQAKQDDFDLDLLAIGKTWQYGSVVRSWLLDMAVRALEEDGDLESLASYVEDSGEGRWTVNESVELAVPTPVITAALYQRFRSRQEQPFSGRMLAALRNQFGGHAVRNIEP
ncbi:6-phosphogluconate dehydrogenase, NAD(+)-dependent, decarboxylating [Geodia barretti]|uniref:phosphogluconate dehydrogenase (NADP(+)-dependent, decarboxylating) n=1 Tax=Geodia barretti TaxID=519541 RepID=A0AA35SCR1_GEOBA|nr:6-phosphogluconate dehydrogenase, NAD(+)-dependent, decarboxylating [Geodia barretti]